MTLMSLDRAVRRAFAYKRQRSRFDTCFHQLYVWVVQLRLSKLYSKLLGDEISCGAPTQQ